MTAITESTTTPDLPVLVSSEYLHSCFFFWFKSRVLQPSLHDELVWRFESWYEICVGFSHPCASMRYVLCMLVADSLLREQHCSGWTDFACDMRGMCKVISHEVEVGYNAIIDL